MICYQIFSADGYTYTATASGLKIFEMTSDALYSYIDYNEGFTTVGGNSSTIYLGTKTSGIKYINITCISGSIDSPYDLGTCLVDLSVPDITSNSINYLHVKDYKMTVCTESGVDYFRFNTNPEIHSKTYTSLTNKCFTTSDSIYYTIAGTNTITSGIEYSLNRLDTCLTDWASPSYSYTTGSGIFGSGIKLTDMYITERTAENNGNTIFCTTTSGVYVIDEDLKEYAIYYTR